MSSATKVVANEAIICQIVIKCISLLGKDQYPSIGEEDSHKKERISTEYLASESDGCGRLDLMGCFREQEDTKVKNCRNTRIKASDRYV